MVSVVRIFSILYIAAAVALPEWRSAICCCSLHAQSELSASCCGKPSSPSESACCQSVEQAGDSSDACSTDSKAWNCQRCSCGPNSLPVAKTEPPLQFNESFSTVTTSAALFVASGAFDSDSSLAYVADPPGHNLRQSFLGVWLK